VLAVTAIFLARETKSLLIGESAHPKVKASILRIARNDAAVAHVNDVLTFQMGPGDVSAALSAEFHDRLKTPEIEAAVHRIEDAIKLAHPDIRTLFVKPQTAKSWRNRTAELAAPRE
jgi:divalent metal cation (Fe/Co/Zn/Cd) transporter